jgi:uncharacterized protein (DUF58 family)
MIYPTARAVGLAAVGVPLAVGTALVAPQLWLVGPAWLAIALALILIDMALGAWGGQLSLALNAPSSLSSNSADGEASIDAVFAGRTQPRMVETSLEANERLRVEPFRNRGAVVGGGVRIPFRLKPVRRGPGMLIRIWARWRGPLGLVWKQKVQIANRPLPITLNIRGVKDEAMRLFSRNALHGQRIQEELGGGSEFHALRDFQAGMDRRTIDWKQSARHRDLLAKEFRTERNHHVMLVMDTGRLMCEPVGGVPRIDQALNAALLLAYVSLKTGDRVGLFGFDARPNVSSGVRSGTQAFAHIQHLAAQIDYTANETNFTLGLSALSARLGRRSLLVVFTDFADSTSAELMLEGIGRLLAQHLVLFVVMRDEELETLEREAPETAEDVSRAAVAAAMIQERQIVVERLRRLGALIVEAKADAIGPALLSRYLDLKRRDLL